MSFRARRNYGTRSHNINSNFQLQTSFQQSSNAVIKIDPEPVNVLAIPDTAELERLNQLKKQQEEFEKTKNAVPQQEMQEQQAIDKNQNVDPEMEQDDNSSSFYDGNGKLHFRKIFKSRKKPSVRAKEKKLRQNRQLRRSLFPKNALMALNEVKGITISEFSFTTNESGGFTATVSVNGKQHEGKGTSKIVAKNNASESALRDFVIAKMLERPRPTKRNKTSSISGSQSELKVDAMNVVEIDDTSSIADSQKSTNADENDDLPMINLASFALYKLFSEWEREGFTVPEMHPNAENNTQTETDSVSMEPVPKEPKKPTLRTELPISWETMHPATLLCMMRPGLTYTDYGTSGDKTDKLHCVGAVVDGKEFNENGRSKKIARRNVAVSVCNTLFGTNFDKDVVA